VKSLSSCNGDRYWVSLRLVMERLATNPFLIAKLNLSQFTVSGNYLKISSSTSHDMKIDPSNKWQHKSNSCRYIGERMLQVMENGRDIMRWFFFVDVALVICLNQIKEDFKHDWLCFAIMEPCFSFFIYFLIVSVKLITFFFQQELVFLDWFIIIIVFLFLS